MIVDEEIQILTGRRRMRWNPVTTTKIATDGEEDEDDMDDHYQYKC
jgi:hypothetical protein